MWMAWGEELTFFCNAAYRRDTLGRKYPWALGRPASEVWAEIWEEIGPRIETVLSTGKATWDEALLLFLERSGFPEETYHTFSYSPLRDDGGAVVGMLCVVNEETERIVAERRMETLRDLGSDPTAVRTETEMLAFTPRQLERNLKTFPFTLTYLFDEGVARPQPGSSGIAEGHPAAPCGARGGRPGGALVGARAPRRRANRRWSSSPGWSRRSCPPGSGRGRQPRSRSSRCPGRAAAPTASWSPRSTGTGPSTRATAASSS